MLAVLFASMLAFAQGRDLGYTQEEGEVGYSLIAPGHALGARFAFEPPDTEVGEPVELVLYVPHDASENVSVDSAALDLDTSWIVFEGPSRSTVPDAHDATRATTRVSWKIASLEPGEREMPAIEVKIARKSEAPHAVSVSAAKLNARAVLGPNEDAPRPPKGFRPVAAEVESRAWLPWTLGGAAVLVLGGGALAMWLVKRNRLQPAPQPSRLELIEALAQRDVEQPVVVREVHYELARLLREVFDSRHGVSRTALTDEEWLQAVAASFTPEHLNELAEILRVSAEVKYGAAQPTQWAVRETIQRARKVASTGTTDTGAPAQGAAA
jgi:hypothetical protein